MANGRWLRVKYQTKNFRMCWLEIFFPSTKSGSRLVDDFTKEFLESNENVILLDVEYL